MNIVETGDAAGEPLLFLHGGNVAGWMWGQQVPAFMDYRILVPDLPGFGLSNQMPWVSTADAADALADVLPDTPAHVVGLSLGSSVAVQLAARHPERVASLFLASAQVAPPRRRDVLLGRVTLLAWNQRGFWAATARAYGLTGADAEEFIHTGLGIRRSTAVTILDEVARGIPSTVLQSIRAPVLAVAGSQDSAAITDTSLRLLREWVPRALTAHAPGAHHQWNIEDVPLFNAALGDWLRKRAVNPGLDPV